MLVLPFLFAVDLSDSLGGVDKPDSICCWVVDRKAKLWVALNVSKCDAFAVRSRRIPTSPFADVSSMSISS